MYELADILESVIRAAGAGAALLLAAALAFGKAGSQQTRRLGALFLLSTAFYALLSGEATADLFGPYVYPYSFIAVFGTVFFWWFASALFDDRFRWRWWRIAPLFILAASHYGHVTNASGPIEEAAWYIHMAVNIAMFGDVMRMALLNAGDDLINPRRRFRAVIASTIAVFGIIIAIAETAHRSVELPVILLYAHGAAILAMLIVFGPWLIGPRSALFDEASAVPAPVSGPPDSDRVSAAERPAYDRLTTLMDNGVYRREGLSVAALAEEVGVPEHQLRRLINRELGFRNFSSFLNARRIADAREILAAPENAKKQILQVALDLGYGSIASFNRAFKAKTGLTPTDFRRNALNGANQN